VAQESGCRDATLQDFDGRTRCWHAQLGANVHPQIGDRKQALEYGLTSVGRGF